MDVHKDVLIEIISQLDAVSISRLLWVSTRFWKLRTKEAISDRIIPYKKYIAYQQWNKGLCESVKRNHFPQILYFIENGADDLNLGLAASSRSLVHYFVNLGANAWSFALEGACSRGQKELVDYFMEKGGNVWYENDLYLENAARGGHLELLMYLAEKRPPNVQKWNRIMASASQGGFKNIVEYCVQQGADDWERSLLGACFGGMKPFMEYFYQKNLKIPKIAIVCAAAQGHREIVTWLLDKREKKNQRTWNMALQGAAQGGDRELVEIFIEKGADGWNDAMIEAVRTGQTDLVKFFRQKGANCDLSELLVLASIEDHREVIDVLIDLGADDFGGALYAAAANGHKALVEKFLVKGAMEISEDHIRRAIKKAESGKFNNTVRVLEEAVKRRQAGSCNPL